MYLVARVGRAHGLRGEVTVQVHTDAPEQRFVPGAVFATEPATVGPLTVAGSRVHNGIQLLTFAEVRDRSAAEALRGVRLVMDDPDDVDEDEDAFYPEDLVGLIVRTVAGDNVGTVAELQVREVQDLLVVDLTAGGQALIPFVTEIVPEVDEDAGVVLIDPPEGLLELGLD